MSKNLRQIRKQRKEILSELAALEQMRRGSLVPQTFEATRKDGTKVLRGPYMLYTRKDGSKTVSRRVKQPGQAERYQKQIDAYRRFDALTRGLVRIGEKISDLVLADEEEQKKKRS